MKHFLKPLRAAVVAALGLAVLAGAALAQAPASLAEHQAGRVDNRQARQSDRITHGVEQGQITPREQLRLERQQRHINRLERRTNADGHVNAREAVRVERAQDRASRNIARSRAQPPGRAAGGRRGGGRATWRKYAQNRIQRPPIKRQRLLF